ncbi:MAG TPA: cation-transporting P-type ATPase [Polyangiaceae bacterium]|nr:cation-transporting P-type ATPase [Polyangiaceae bacterium]
MTVRSTLFGAVGALRAATASVQRQLGPRRRRAWQGKTRAHVELRETRGSERAVLERCLDADVGSLPGVRAVRLSHATGRAVVEVDAGGPELDTIVAAVDRAEAAAGLGRARLRESTWEHPADFEAAERLVVAMFADAIGVASGTLLRFSLIPRSRLASTLASLLQIIQTSPRLRRGLDERFGPLRADLLLGIGAALAHGVAQRPGSAFVELAHRFVQLGEVNARRQSWETREPDLFDLSAPRPEPPADPEQRPCPLPRGPIEEYADRALWVSLAGFGVSFVATASVQRAVAAFFGGLPKPAELGRDVFASELGRTLARRGVLVLDPAVLRRLDRIDCLVLTHDLVARHRWEVRALVRADAIEEIEVRARVAGLFDPDQPVLRREGGGFALEPLGASVLEIPAELAARVNELGAQGGLVLALRRGAAVVALVEIEIVSRTGIDELMAAAREAGMRVVVAAPTDAVLGLAADDTIGDGEGMVRGIRRLQREGRGVCVVAGSGASSALAAADCGIGLLHAGAEPPWGAHLVCEEDLSEPRFLLHACAAARQVSKQSVNVALGAATVGALVSAGGVLPTTGRRVIAVVNAASLLSMLNGARSSLKLSRRKLPPPRDRTPWHALDVRAVLARLGTGSSGLERKEALARRRVDHTQRSGLVELVEAIGDELFNPLAPLLAAGAGLSAAVGSFGDATMVGGVVALNAVVGGVQRHRTERAIRELSRAARRRALVRRGGQLLEIDADQLVHGDIVLLAAGDVVPADCRIVESESLEVDASSMTGESMPVKRQAAPSFELDMPDRGSMLYEGTAIAAGRVTAVAVAVGDETEARRGALVSKRDAVRGGVERRLRSLIQLTGPMAIGAGVGLVAAGLLRGRKLEDLVGSSVSLAVASVPEGLPLLATAAQLAAAERLAKRGALVRNARSIEALGRVDVLCVDKTGTLTEGRIELVEVSDGETLQSLTDLGAVTLPVLAAALRASAERGGRSFDPTEQALYRAADRMDVRTEYACTGFQRAFETSFEAGRGYHATVGNCDAGLVLDVKGAPEVVLARCTGVRRGGQRQPLDGDTSAALARHAAALAARGLRVLAVAERIVPQGDSLDPKRLVGLTFLGFLAFSDPVRLSATQAVKELSQAGVRVIMITGDHPATADAVARDVGIFGGTGVLTGSELSEVDDESLARRIRGVNVFARVTPPQKVRIVRALQRAGRVVAMVGDGANDAPAIRLANVGIAVGEQSTTAARAAADIVLIDARLETLVDAVLEGRAMWAAVRDAVSILVGGNLGEIGFTLGAGLFDGRPPLNARQLLLVNLLTDVAPAMAIALRPPAPRSIRSLAYEGPDISLGQPLNRQIAARAVVTALGASSAFGIARFTGTRARASTVGLVALVGTQLGQTLTSGQMSRPVIVTGVASAAALALIVQTPGLSHAFGCRPLGLLGWTTAIGASTAATVGAALLPDLVARLRGETAPAVVLADPPVLA